MTPDFLYHYFDSSTGPFCNLSDLPPDDAKITLDLIKRNSGFFAFQRQDDYLQIRSKLERKVRSLLIKKGGQPTRRNPHYMILGRCDWLLSWYPDPQFIKIPLKKFDSKIISFTYGDSFPAMHFDDNAKHFENIYLMNELSDLINEYGLPQKINPDGVKGPKRYIEAQIWNDKFIKSSIEHFPDIFE